MGALAGLTTLVRKTPLGDILKVKAAKKATGVNTADDFVAGAAGQGDPDLGAVADDAFRSLTEEPRAVGEKVQQVDDVAQGYSRRELMRTGARKGANVAGEQVVAKGVREGSKGLVGTQIVSKETAAAGLATTEGMNLLMDDHVEAPSDLLTD